MDVRCYKKLMSVSELCMAGVVLKRYELKQSFWTELEGFNQLRNEPILVYHSLFSSQNSSRFPLWGTHYCGWNDSATMFTLNAEGMLKQSLLSQALPAGTIVKLFRILGPFLPVVAPVIFLHVLGAKPGFR